MARPNAERIASWVRSRTNANPDRIEQVQPNDEMKQIYPGLHGMTSWSLSQTNAMTRADFSLKYEFAASASESIPKNDTEIQGRSASK